METGIPIAELRERLLSLVDSLPRNGLLVTREGKAVARLMPIRPRLPRTDSLKGIVTDPADDLFSSGEQWGTEA